MVRAMEHMRSEQTSLENFPALSKPPDYDRAHLGVMRVSFSGLARILHYACASRLIIIRFGHSDPPVSQETYAFLDTLTKPLL